MEKVKIISAICIMVIIAVLLALCLMGKIPAIISFPIVAMLLFFEKNYQVGFLVKISKR